MTNLYGNALDIYDLQHDRSTDDLPFYDRLFGWMEAGQPLSVLELGCGSGRLLPTFLGTATEQQQSPSSHATKRLRTVTGLDREATALERARKRPGVTEAIQAGQLRLIEADMRSFQLPQRHHLAILALNSFMHLLTRDDQRDCLACIHHHLDDHGSIVIDLHNPLLFLRDRSDDRLRHRFTHTHPETGGIVNQWSVETVDAAAQSIDATIFTDHVSPDNGIVTRGISQLALRFTFRYELESLLQSAGFRIEETYGDYELSDYAEDSPRLIVLAGVEHR